MLSIVKRDRDGRDVVYSMTKERWQAFKQTHQVAAGMPGMRDRVPARKGERYGGRGSG